MAVPASPAIFLLAAAKMRAICAPPLADPDDPRTRSPPPFARDATGLFGDLPPRFPVLLFSHGLAGNRLAYSQFCGELASHGIVVAALSVPRINKSLEKRIAMLTRHSAATIATGVDSQVQCACR